MNNTVLLFLVLLAAIASGWWLGVRHRRAEWPRPGRQAALPVSEGLNYLLNEQPDSALEAFIEGLAVRPDTLETHLAFGTLLRRRGEVDRAIRIHQNLLEHRGLGPSQRAMARLELGRDYAASGWLDRAERIFREVLPAGGAFEAAALKQLLPLYEAGREWGKAIHVAKRLMVLQRCRDASGEAALQVATAHYHCELAGQALAAGKPAMARRQLLRALQTDPSSLRAAILMAQATRALGDPAAALQGLCGYARSCPQAVPDLVDALEQAFVAAGEHAAFVPFLLESLQREPSLAVVLKAVGSLHGAGQADQASALVTEQVRQRPSLRGIQAVLNLHVPEVSGKARDPLQWVTGMIDHLLQGRPAYQCSRCGFSGAQLHWQCPGCSTWGTVARIRGMEGD